MHYYDTKFSMPSVKYIINFLYIEKTCRTFSTALIHTVNKYFKVIKIPPYTNNYSEHDKINFVILLFMVIAIKSHSIDHDYEKL